MKVFYHISRIIFGAWFLFSGVEFFLPQLGLQPLGNHPLSIELTLALIHSGLFFWVKVVEVIVGALLLINRAVLPANLAVLPLTVVIAYWNLVLEFGLVEWTFGILTIVFNLAMLWPFRARIFALLDWKTHGADFSLAIRGGTSEAKAPSGEH